MKKIRELETLSSLHSAIKFGKKGSTDQIAEHLGVSRACMYKYLEELKQLGAEVEYCRTKRCFRYLNNFHFKISIETPELELVYGGRKSVPYTKKRRKSFLFELGF